MPSAAPAPAPEALEAECPERPPGVAWRPYPAAMQKEGQERGFLSLPGEACRPRGSCL